MHRKGDVGEKNTLWVSGGAGMFRKKIWETLGGLDLLYNPFYWEDIDLSYRAVKRGYKIAFEDKSVVIHTHSEGSIQNIYSPAEIKTIAYRNQFFFVWLNITDLDFLFKHFIFIPFHLIKALISFDFPLIKGFFLAILKLPHVLSHRLKNQKKNTLSDKEVFRNIS